MKIYLGCDLFTEGQRIQALFIQRELEEKIKGVEVYNPADNMDINDKEAGFSFNYEILLADYKRLKEADILIGLMDTKDLGLAAEMGIAFERGIPIFQLYTDIRLEGSDKKDKLSEMSKDIFQNDFLYINKLVTGLSYADKDENIFNKPRIFQKKEDLVKAVVDYVKNI